jgi:UrcA family protein
MNKLTAMFAVAAIAGLFYVNADAGTPSDVPTQAVRYRDLQSANIQDVAVLYRRIDAAAGTVCGERLAPGSLHVSPTWRRCEQNALRQAVADINAPAMTAYAAAQGVLAHDSSVARN